MSLPFVDLESAPPSNGYLNAEDLSSPEKWFPLRVQVCENCWLVQTEDFTDFAELFAPDYAYFSSYSTSWLQHAEAFVAAAVERFDLGGASTVVEVASNDGYLLDFFQRRGIPCYGIEPTAGTAAVARAKGLDVVLEFFDSRLAARLKQERGGADLMVANNVLAHVPNVNDFVAGFAELLKPTGVATFEFPHVVRLVAENQFDTIYHEHFSYFSLVSVQRIFAANGLNVFDVEELPTHGGSLRIFCQRSDAMARQPGPRVNELLNQELALGVNTKEFYIGMQKRALDTKCEFLSFLLRARDEGKVVAGYGAAAKGNTLLNFAGVRSDLISFVVDRNPAKQRKYLPGSRIPIVNEDVLRDRKPEYVVIFPWNLRDEIRSQLQYVKEWGGSLVTAVPSIEVA